MKLEGDSQKGKILLFGIILTVVAVWYWFQAVKWWIADDPAILQFAAQYPLPSFFFSPTLWRRFSPSNLTPMVLLSFKFDLLAFGLKPSFYYLHQEVIAALVAFVFYLILLRRMPWFIAASVSMAFMLSASMSQCANLLMTRHYLEGLLLCLMSVLLLSRYLQSRNLLVLAGSVCCYALASLCKEVFVPLPLVLALWPEDGSFSVSTFKDWLAFRAATIAPFFVWLVVYAGYRRWMLGRFGGGYGTLSFLPNSGQILNNFYHGVFMKNPFLLMVFLVSLLVVVIAAVRSFRILLFCLAVLIGVMIPFVAVPNLSSERHMLLPTLLAFSLVAFGLARLWSIKQPVFKVVSWAVMLVMVISSLQVHAASYGAQRPFLHSFERTGRFLWYDSSPKDAVVNPDIPNWYYNGLAWLKERVAKRGAIGRGISNFCYAAALGGYQKGYRLWEYNHKRERVVPVLDREVNRRVKECLGRFKKEKLLAWIWQEKEGVRWMFGPFSKGCYYLVDRDTGFKYRLPKEGSFPATLDSLSLNPEKLAVCYEDRKGWRCCATPRITGNPPPSSWLKKVG